MELLIEPGASRLLARLAELLAAADIKAYVVGGFVRDVLLGRDTADIDIAVRANALEVAPGAAATLGGKYIPLDRINRIGRVILNKEGGPQEKRPWTVDFTTIEGTIKDDLTRRDFTIDAIAIDLSELVKGARVRLIDPHNGQPDLQEGVIRAVSQTAFTTDAARLLRAVRLAAELGFSIDKATETLIQSQSHLIAGVAGERVREELLRLLAIPKSEQLPYLDRLGLITAIIPELAPARGVEQPKEHFFDVFEHSLRTVTAVDYLLRQGGWEYSTGGILVAAPWSAELARHFSLEVSHGSTRRLLLKLAALLHDIAKPQTRAIDAQGRTRFLGHAEQGATVAADILQRLRFSAREIKLVETMVRYHLRPGQLTRDELPSSRAIYRYFRDAGEAGIDTLFLNLADHLAARGPGLDMFKWIEHARLVDYVLARHSEQESRVVPSRLVSGHDLINIFSMRPGPGMGELLEQLREAQASGELTTREEALSYIQERLLSKVV